MRRVINRTPREEGAVLIWIATLLPVLIGFGALVVDVGALYQEKQELRNGADAAALSAAKTCALATGSSCVTDATTTANTLADANARDGYSAVDTVCGSGKSLAACAVAPTGTTGATGWVQVTTSTQTATGTSVNLLLAQIFGKSTSTVHATSVAAWGTAQSATTPPMALSTCAFNAAVPGGVPNGQIATLYFDNAGDNKSETCNVASPSGGFGWLEDESNGLCLLTIDLDTDPVVESDPGANATGGCFENWNGNGTAKYRPGSVVPVGVYDSGTGNGSNGEYTLVGFAAFEIIKYTFPSSENPKGTKCPISNENSCLVGKFTTYTTSGTFGNGTNYGVSAVKIIG